MPNWVKNILEVYGDEAEFIKMMDDIKRADSPLHFHNIWSSGYAFINDDGHLEFDTAWSAPKTAVQELAAKYPNLSFVYNWADEDYGANTGNIEYRNGRPEFEYYPDKFSKDDEAIYNCCWNPHGKKNTEEK